MFSIASNEIKMYIVPLTLYLHHFRLFVIHLLFNSIFKVKLLQHNEDRS